MILSTKQCVDDQSSSSGTKEDEQVVASKSNLRSITVSDEILGIYFTLYVIYIGFGSHGTVVYKGGFEGRPVAVKRLLLDFYDVAETEVKLLRDSDHHPNVIRYYMKEQTDRFGIVSN
jgi:serine/threonine protein kinase